MWIWKVWTLRTIRRYFPVGSQISLWRGKP